MHSNAHFRDGKKREPSKQKTPTTSHTHTSHYNRNTLCLPAGPVISYSTSKNDVFQNGLLESKPKNKGKVKHCRAEESFPLNPGNLSGHRAFCKMGITLLGS